MKRLVFFIVFIAICFSVSSMHLIQKGYILRLTGDEYPLDSLAIRKYNHLEKKKFKDKMRVATAETATFFPWKDVLNSLSTQKVTPKVYVVSSTCDRCQQNLVVVHFVSPPWTWEKYCGRAGELVICSHCMRQLDFVCTLMN